MEYKVTGSSAQASTDPDRITVQHFEKASFPASGQKITVISSDPPGRLVTFALFGEDHTLGNALRWQLMRYTDKVDFCGYSMPHPSEAKVHLRIQVSERAPKEVTAVALLKAALLDLKALYADLKGRFAASSASLSKQ